MAAASLFLALPVLADGSTYVWSGSDGNNLWNDIDNWDLYGSGQPGAGFPVQPGDYADIGSSSAVSLSTSINVAGINIGNDVILYTNGNNLNLGADGLTGGSMTIEGSTGDLSFTTSST